MHSTIVVGDAFAALAHIHRPVDHARLVGAWRRFQAAYERVSRAFDDDAVRDSRPDGPPRLPPAGREMLFAALVLANVLFAYRGDRELARSMLRTVRTGFRLALRLVGPRELALAERLLPTPDQVAIAAPRAARGTAHHP